MIIRMWVAIANWCDVQIGGCRSVRWIAGPWHELGPVGCVKS